MAWIAALTPILFPRRCSTCRTRLQADERDNDRCYDCRRADEKRIASA